jgi:hypothetical protein
VSDRRSRIHGATSRRPPACVVKGWAAWGAWCTVASLVLLGLLDCRDHDTEKVELVLRRFRVTHPCAPTTIRIQGRFGVSQDDACVVTMAVRHAIALGGAASVGVRSADSALIESAIVSPVRLTKPSGDGIAIAAWTTTLSFQGRATNIEAFVDQLTGRIRFEPTERYQLERVSGPHSE